MSRKAKELQEIAHMPEVKRLMIIQIKSSINYLHRLKTSHGHYDAQKEIDNLNLVIECIKGV